MQLVSPSTRDTRWVVELVHGIYGFHLESLGIESIVQEAGSKSVGILKLKYVVYAFCVLMVFSEQGPLDHG